ncbi:MAG: hypothetical protein Q7S70_01300 [bacterium]|nr:hypothetical protein [bacterium]
MIPLVSISHLIALPFLAFVAFRLCLSFQRTKEKNIRYFFLVFLMLTIMGSLLASPGLIFKSLTKIDTVFALYPMFVLLSLGFFGAIPFNILNKKRAEKLFLGVMFFMAIFVTMINLGNIQPAIVQQQPPFIYWEDTRGLPMNIFLGVISGLILCSLLVFFLINGLKSPDRYVKIRSFLISGGIISLFLAAIINFAFGAILRQYVTSLISTFLIIISSIFVFTGVLYKK